MAIKDSNHEATKLNWSGSANGWRSLRWGRREGDETAGRRKNPLHRGSGAGYGGAAVSGSHASDHTICFLDSRKLKGPIAERPYEPDTKV